MAEEVLQGQGVEELIVEAKRETDVQPRKPIPDLGVNFSRYFGSVRTVLIVRFDAGIADPYEKKDIRDERDPDPARGRRVRTPVRRVEGENRSFSEIDTRFEEGQTRRFTQAETRFFNPTRLRDIITSSRTNLGDALAKFPLLDGMTRIFDLAPVTSTRRVNGYRKADELDLSFEWSAVPFDSRAIRAIFVLHYEGTVPAESWGTGIRERSPGSPSPSGYLVPATGENLRFMGTIDEIQDAHGDSGDELSMKGRDLTGILIDAKFPPKLDIKIGVGKTILDAIRSILDTNELFELIRGPFLRSEEALPALSPARYPRLAIPAKERHKKDKSGGTGFVLRHPPKGGGQSTYWDVITELCVSHGLRPMIDLDRLVLVEPRVLYKELPTEILSPGQLTFPTKYRRQIGDTSPIRRMVYGVNVAALRFSRKLGRVKAPIVEVSSVNPDAKKASERLLIARHPPEKYKQLTQAKQKARTANSVDATGTKPQAKIHVVQLHGILDLAQLEKVAQQIYEGMGRGELGVVIETDDLASFSDHPGFDPNEDPDLLAIRAGDPVEILVAPVQGARSNLFTLSDLQAMLNRARALAGGGSFKSPRGAVAYLELQGWNKATAEQFIKVLISANLPREFRVFGANISFDGENGFNVQLDCRDYVRVRADPSSPTQTRALRGTVSGARSPSPEPDGPTTSFGEIFGEEDV